VLIDMRTTQTKMPVMADWHLVTKVMSLVSLLLYKM